MKAEYNDEYGVLVTEDGRIFREVAQWTDKHGYNAVTLKTTDCKHKNMFVHRLVAMGFCDKGSENFNIVMHIDDNPQNNHYSNLKWGTSQENNRFMCKEDIKNGYEIQCLETGEIFTNVRDAGRKMFGDGDKGSHIIDVCRGTRNKVYGYHFEFVKGGD